MGTWSENPINISWSVGAFLFMFEGSRRLLVHGAGKNAFSIVVGGVVLSITLGGEVYLKYHAVSLVASTANQPVFAAHLPLPDNWGGKCCQSNLEASSRALVKAAFVESGQLHSYFNSIGERVPFIPTQVELREREERVVSNALIEEALRDRLFEMTYITVAALFSMLVGAVIGYEQRNSSGSGTSETPRLERNRRSSH